MPKIKLSRLKKKVKKFLPKLNPYKWLLIPFSIALCIPVVNTFNTYWDNYIRSYVAENVVRIQTPRGGGTGFHITTKFATYILTNAHICDLSEDGNVWVEHNGSIVSKKILYNSDYSDLCLVEPVKYSGLSFGDSSYVGEKLKVLGHPKLQPLTLQEGEFIIASKVMIPERPIFSKEDKEKCSKPKQSIKTLTIEFFGAILQQEICVITFNGLFTSVVIYPGNSGSPLVDSWGRVKGLMAASNNETHWGVAVSLEDILSELKRYEQQN